MSVILRYGGWDIENEADGTKATVWYNTKGYHAMPAYYNALNNMVLRANMERNRKSGQYGITVYNHPLNATRGQLSRFTL